LEKAELEEDQEIRRRLTTYIVIGGGSSGVEIAGEIADFLAIAKKYYSCVSNTTARIVLLESGDRLLSEFPEVLGESALQYIRENGIEVRLNTGANMVAEHGVKIDGGEWIAADNIICTIGTKPNHLVQKLPLPKHKGLIKTMPDMSVANFRGLWAIGDCAAVINSENDNYSPPTAQFAVQQGKQLAKNIARAVSGTETHSFRYRSRGQLATIGHRKAVAHVFGINLIGFPAWLMWRAVYLLMLPTLLRKLQVFSEWNLELLFPRDVTQLDLKQTNVPHGNMTKRKETVIKSAASH
jgi:NADH dehydrogenase